MISVGTNNLISHKFLHFPPDEPRKPKVVIFFLRASFNTLITFLELPDVEITISTSFLFARAWKVLVKISVKS